MLNGKAGREKGTTSVVPSWLAPNVGLSPVDAVKRSRLSRRPVQSAAANQVDVQMENGLSGPRANV